MEHIEKCELARIKSGSQLVVDSLSISCTTNINGRLMPSNQRYAYAFKSLCSGKMPERGIIVPICKPTKQRAIKKYKERMVNCACKNSQLFYSLWCWSDDGPEQSCLVSTCKYQQAIWFSVRLAQEMTIFTISCLCAATIRSPEIKNICLRS